MAFDLLYIVSLYMEAFPKPGRIPKQMTRHIEKDSLRVANGSAKQQINHMDNFDNCDN